MREQDLLGNGKLTVLARLASVYLAFAGTAFAGIAGAVGWEIWGYVKDTRRDVDRLMQARSKADEKVVGHDGRITRLEGVTTEHGRLLLNHAERIVRLEAQPR